MELDTLTIETPIGKNKVVLRTWITGLMADQLQGVLLEGVDINQVGSEITQDIKIPATKVIAYGHKRIEVYVLSVDDKKDDLVNTVLSMRAEDTAFILENIEKINSKKK